MRPEEPIASVASPAAKASSGSAVFARDGPAAGRMHAAQRRPPLDHAGEGEPCALGDQHLRHSHSWPSERAASRPAQAASASLHPACGSASKAHTTARCGMRSFIARIVPAPPRRPSKRRRAPRLALRPPRQSAGRGRRRACVRCRGRTSAAWAPSGLRTARAPTAPVHSMRSGTRHPRSAPPAAQTQSLPCESRPLWRATRSRATSRRAVHHRPGAANERVAGRCSPRSRICSPPAPTTRPRSARRAACRSRTARLRALVADTVAQPERARHRPQRPRRDRARQRAGDGGGVPRIRRAARPRRRSIRPIAPTNSSSICRPARQGCWSSRAARQSPAIAVARELGVPIARLVADAGARRGDFTLEFAGDASRRLRRTAASPSRTTSRWCCTRRARRRGRRSCRCRQRNICASARNIRAHAGAHGDGPRPEHHAAVPHPRPDRRRCWRRCRPAARSCCTPGFNALKFFGWMDEAQADLVHGGADDAPGDPAARAEQRRRSSRATGCASSARRRRRCRRRSSRELEATFGAPRDRGLRHDRGGAPDGEQSAAAGRAQAGHGRPRRRTGDRDHGRRTASLLAAGATGEIVIRGANVMPATRTTRTPTPRPSSTAGSAPATRACMDADGYVSITGRLKEIINRGGEKISPREVDEIMMDHPAVAPVRDASRMPHAMLGEEVAAAVVLREGATATERELREFVADSARRLQGAAKILILDEIPMGATGKLQRIGLAEKLGPRRESPPLGRPQMLPSRFNAAHFSALARAARWHRWAASALPPGSRPSRSSSSSPPAPAAAPTRWRASSRAWSPSTT